MAKTEDAGKKETLYFIFLLGFSKVITYLVLLVLANWFILPDFGRASFVMSIFRAVVLFGGIGLPFIYVPWIINKKDTSSIFYFLLILNLIFMGIGLAIGIKHVWILPIIFAIPFMAINGVCNAILRVKHQYHIIQILGVLLELVALVSFVFLANYGKAGIVGGHAVSFYVISLAFMYLTRKELWNIVKKVRLNLDVVWEYVKKGTITSVLYLSMVFLNWIDSIILGAISTFENVAKYNVAGPVSNVIATIPFSLSMFLLTRESEVKSKKLSKSILGRALRLSFSLSLIAAILMLSLIYPLIEIFFPKYIGVEVYIMILTIGILFYSLYSLIFIYETGKLQPEKMFWPIFLAALINIGLDFLLIPKYGLYGITIATTIAHAFAFVTIIYKVNLVKEFISAFILLAFVPLSFYIGVLGILLIPVALGCSYLLGLLKEGDLYTVADTFFQIFERFK